MADRSSTDTALPENIRIPLHELQADVDYLIGRVIADGSCGLMIAKSIKDKLARIEAGVLSVAQAAPEPADEIDRLRRALELLTDELPEEMRTLDEPDEDWEVIVKMRAIAREAMSPSDRGGAA